MVDIKKINVGTGNSYIADKMVINNKAPEIGKSISESEDFILALKEVNNLLKELEKERGEMDDKSFQIIVKERLEKRQDLTNKIVKGIKSGGFEALKTLISNNPIATFFIEAAKEITS